MDHCKFCQAELPEDSTVCPQCGKDNAEQETAAETAAAEEAEVTTQEETAEAVHAAEEETEEAAPEAEEAEQPVPKKKFSTGQIALGACALIVLLVVLAALVFGGTKKNPEMNENDVTATVPADGNPDDVTCKGTYTADDQKLTKNHDKVIATAGDDQLTVGQLQAYYWMEVRSFLNNYGAYAAYLGLDYTQPLDTQMCTMSETPITWQQFFLDSAINSWHTYLSMAREADAAGVPMDEAYVKLISNIDADLEESAKANGFASGEDVIHQSLGNSATVEDYRYFMEMYYHGYGYYNDFQNGINPTDAELSAYFDAHADEYGDSGITKDSYYVDVRHILIPIEEVETEAETEAAEETAEPAQTEAAEETEAAEAAESTEAEEIPEDELGDYTREAWLAARKKAQDILDGWQAGEMTEDSFAALANEYSTDPGSNTNGGLYTHVAQGDMVPAFDAWCFDPARVPGDTDIVRTPYGYHIMYFVGTTPVWVDYAKQGYVTEKTGAFIESCAAKHPMQVNYKDILLGKVDLSA